MSPESPPQDEEGPVPGLHALRRERQPDAALWAGIEARISPPRALHRRKREPRFWSYGVAASVLAAVLTAVLLPSPPSLPQRAAPAPAPLALSAAVLTQDATVESQPRSHEDDQPPSAVALSSRTLRLLRNEPSDHAPPVVAERVESSGLMKATYAAGKRNYSPVCAPPEPCSRHAVSVGMSIRAASPGASGCKR